MNRPASLVGNVVATRVLRHPWWRRLLALVLVVVFALLALFPQQYRAAASLTPTDPSSLGLSGTLGQLGAFSSVFGNQAAVEISLRVARSQEVRNLVSRKLDIQHKRGFDSALHADRWLKDAVEIRALRGGILQVDTKLDDPVLARRMVGAFIDATRDQLAEISRRQTAYKRKVLVDLVASAGQRLDRAQNAYDQFRRRTRYSQPGTSISAIGARIPAIEAQIKAKEIELRAARTFATDENISVRQILAEIIALRSQLAEARSLDPDDPNSVNRVVIQSTEVQNLERELGIARSLYDSYRRFLEGAAVEDLTSTGNVRVLEPPYIDSARQFRTLPLALLLLVLLTAATIELYQSRPPLGLRRREHNP